SFGTSTTSQSNTLTTLGGTDKAFAFVSGRLNSSSSSATHEGLFRADISSTSNCDVLRGASGTAASATLQVVEFTDSTTVEHQTITASGTSTSTTLSNSIDTTSAFVVYTFSGSSGNLSIVPYCYLSDATTITTGRGASSGTATIEAYVVNMSGVSTEVDTGSNITSTTTPVSISNVTDTSSAFCVFQSSNSGTGTSWANQLSGASMISTTEVDIIKNNTSNTNPWALQTMQC
ncbi:MAG TPA: hypothetical protein VG753_00490, partial [Candidatus Paceibacterota bacterium]|nr:hypothetical protein [Candidatus Paceibacterota bacterium]